MCLTEYFHLCCNKDRHCIYYISVLLWRKNLGLFGKYWEAFSFAPLLDPGLDVEQCQLH